MPDAVKPIDEQSTWRTGAEPIAVVGAACRFPQAPNVAAFWDLLNAGTDAITEVPPSRFDINAVYHPDAGIAGRVRTRYGGFLADVDRFDAPFFGISPHEASRMDPQQRLLLETGWEAIEDAGLSPARLSEEPTGVFVGQLTTNYWDILCRAGVLDIYANVGTARSALSGRLSHAFDLRGPSVSIDSACSSSLVAVHLARRSLLSGDCDIGLAAAVNMILTPEESVTLSQANLLSPDGRCKFASADANGYVRSEGVAVLVLKRLSQAEADGDAIYALVHGSAVTNDGRSGGAMMSPGLDGQVRALRAAYADAGVSPDDIGYVEAHGTGTSAGDPVELRSLAEVFGTPSRSRPLVIGSVKTNIGHTEAAAGMAGLIKAMLCVRHRVIPASLHNAQLTTAVDWSRSPLTVQRGHGAWPVADEDHPALAGVSSFGISGTNAHVVLGEYRPDAGRADGHQGANGAGPAQLLTFSAAVPAALRDLAGAYAEFLTDGPGRHLPLNEICHSAAARRRHHEHRLTIVGEAAAEIGDALRSYVSGAPGAGVETAQDVADQPCRAVFVFSGHGSQWAGMGLELYDTSAVFRTALAECDGAIRAETGWSVLDRLREPDGLAGFEVVQPALWAIQVALAAVWRSMGIEPAVVVGHSMGEVAAAHVAGVLDLSDAAAVICRRSVLLRRVAGHGAMASVDLPADRVAQLLREWGSPIEVAVENSPNLTVVAGDPGGLQRVVERFAAEGVFVRLVNVDIASHSASVDPVLAELAAALAPLQPRPGSIQMFSTVSTAVLAGPELGAGYWVRNVREPVRFASVISDLVDRGYHTFIEVSPHPILTSAVQQCVAGTASRTVVLPTLRREQPERRTMLETVAGLHRAGRVVPLERSTGATGQAVRLPGYPWQRQRYWVDSGAAGAEGGTSPVPPRPEGSPNHPLLGARMTSNDGTATWEGRLDLDLNRYLLDHQVQEHAVLPGTAYLEIMRAAVVRAGLPAAALHRVHYLRGLYLSADHPPVLRVSLATGRTTGPVIEVFSRVDDDEPWLLHATASVQFPAAGTGARSQPEPLAQELAAVRRRCRDRLDGDAFYRRFAAAGNRWAGAFRAVSEIWRGDGEAIGRVTPTPGMGPAGQHVHPALLDACGQVLAATLVDPDPSAPAGPFMLDSIERVTWHRSPDGPVWSRVTRRQAPAPGLVVGDVVISGQDGTRLAELTGLTVRFIEDAVDPPGRPNWLYTLDWLPVATRPASPRAGVGCLVVFVDRRGVGAELANGWPGRAVWVRAGLGFRRLGPDRYEVDPRSSDDHRRLLDEIGPSTSGPDCAGIVHLWSLDTPAADLTCPPTPRALAVNPALNGVPRLVTALTGGVLPGSPPLWLVTRGAQPVDDRDRVDAVPAAALWGLGRSIAAEHPELHCRLLDLDPANPPAAPLRRELLAADDGETQVALRGERRFVARLRPVPAPAGVPLPSPGPGDPPTHRTPPAPRVRRLRPSVRGLLNEVRWVPEAAREPRPGEVEIAVSHAGLNFRDVLVASGAYPGASHPGSLGWECAGEIAAVGAGVAGWSVGDQVLALAQGSLATRVCADVRLVFARPSRLTAQEAVTLPSAFLTAYHGLCELARLERGERVLIHHGTGGVGLAAIQVARLRGAEIYATAGSPERRALLRMLGARHVADSRSTEFASEIARISRGEGVHVVLSGLPAHASAANLSVLAPYGRYVDLAKRVAGAASPLAGAVGDNTAYFTLDVTDMILRRPDIAARTLGTVLPLVDAGLLTALPHEVYRTDRAVEAFEQMSRAQHVGKVVFSFSGTEAGAFEPAADGGADRAADSAGHRGATRAARAVSPPGSFRPTPAGTYLISGGLGDLGLSVGRWLVRNGVRHLLLLGRTAPPPAAQWESLAVDHPWFDRVQVLGELMSSGAAVDVKAVDVTDAAAVGQIVRERAAEGRPSVRGVVHAAGVIDYGPVEALDGDHLAAVLAPKVAGGWVLHSLLRDQPLDFFVLFSSASAILGSPMLGAYAAANASLDALAHHRRARGLPATSINWGFWGGIGMAARADRSRGRVLCPHGMRAFSADEGLDVLGAVLRDNPAQVAVLPVDWPEWRRSYPDAATAPLLRDLPGEVDAVAATGRATEVDRTPRLESGSASAGTGQRAMPVDRSVVAAGATPTGARVDEAPPVEVFLVECVGEVLGLPPAKVNLYRPLDRQGMDSLMAARVRSAVHQRFGLVIPIARMLGGATLADLSAELVGVAGGPSAAAAGSEDPNVDRLARPRADTT